MLDIRYSTRMVPQYPRMLRQDMVRSGTATVTCDASSSLELETSEWLPYGTRIAVPIVFGNLNATTPTWYEFVVTDVESTLNWDTRAEDAPRYIHSYRCVESVVFDLSVHVMDAVSYPEGTSAKAIADAILDGTPWTAAYDFGYDMSSLPVMEFDAGTRWDAMRQLMSAIQPHVVRDNMVRWIRARMSVQDGTNRVYNRVLDRGFTSYLVNVGQVFRADSEYTVSWSRSFSGYAYDKILVADKNGTLFKPSATSAPAEFQRSQVNAGSLLYERDATTARTFQPRTIVQNDSFDFEASKAGVADWGAAAVGPMTDPAISYEVEVSKDAPYRLYPGESALVEDPAEPHMFLPSLSTEGTPLYVSAVEVDVLTDRRKYTLGVFEAFEPLLDTRKKR